MRLMFRILTVSVTLMVVLCFVVGCDDGFEFFSVSKPSEGLEFEINYEQNSCTLVGLGNCTDTDIVIPSEYEGYPVVTIGGAQIMTGGGLTGPLNSERIKSVTLPDSIVKIEPSAFVGCSSLEKIHIPSGVTSIGKEDDNGNIMNSFICSSLKEITVDRRNPVYTAVKNCLIEKETGLLVAGCVNSVIPSDGSVKSIGKYAFWGCEGMTEIHIPASVISIEEDSFFKCDDLVYITVDENNPVYKSSDNRIIEKETGRVVYTAGKDNTTSRVEYE